mmetsp:Transcript_21728/g.32266  ORF Transcript_21728/g.32266 Transcript_21728/m.32266 type:complete len:170 (-) Transcript_21728:59-568(-)
MGNCLEVFPHCTHSSQMDIRFIAKNNETLDSSTVLGYIEQAHDKLDQFSTAPQRKQKSGSKNDVYVGAFETEGCGWIDYSYWRVETANESTYIGSSSTPASTISVRVFSRSSNFLCGNCPNPCRCCCGLFCQCYGDNGENQQHIEQILNQIRSDHSQTLDIQTEILWAS